MIFYSDANKKQAKKSMSAFGRKWNFWAQMGRIWKKWFVNGTF
jgi:hypothetical protein